MLERMGMIRKVDELGFETYNREGERRDGERAPQAEPAAQAPTPVTTQAPAAHAAPVTPVVSAPVQPPVYTPAPEPKPAFTAAPVIPAPVAPKPEPVSYTPPVMAVPAARPAPVTPPVSYTPPVYAAQAEHGYSYDKKGAEVKIEKSFWDDTPPSGPDTDRYMDIEELYQCFGLRTSGVDTVYLIEEYMKTLPDSLPAELRRSIIVRIMSASGFDFDKLLNDGIDRVSRLNEYASVFASHTDEVVSRQNAEIESLERQIAQIQESISQRKNLHKKQFLSIENEAQRLKEVLDFVTK